MVIGLRLRPGNGIVFELESLSREVNVPLLLVFGLGWDGVVGMGGCFCEEGLLGLMVVGGGGFVLRMW